MEVLAPRSGASGLAVPNRRRLRPRAMWLFRRVVCTRGRLPTSCVHRWPTSGRLCTRPLAGSRTPLRYPDNPGVTTNPARASLPAALRDGVHPAAAIRNLRLGIQRLSGRALEPRHASPNPAVVAAVAGASSQHPARSVQPATGRGSSRALRTQSEILRRGSRVSRWALEVVECDSKVDRARGTAPELNANVTTAHNTTPEPGANLTTAHNTTPEPGANVTTARGKAPGYGVRLLMLPLAMLLALAPSPARAEGASFTVRPLSSGVVSPFDGPVAPWRAGHRGVDLLASPGTPVRAPADGVVSFAGTVVDRPVISLRHTADGPREVLSSFEPIVAAVRPGQVVRAGQVIGWAGRGGHCDALCIHWGVRLGGSYVDPLGWLAASVRLLPSDPRPLDLPPAPPGPPGGSLGDEPPESPDGKGPGSLDQVLQAVLDTVVGGQASPAASPPNRSSRAGSPIARRPGATARAAQALGCAWRKADRSRSVVTCV